MNYVPLSLYLIVSFMSVSASSPFCLAHGEQKTEVDRWPAKSQELILTSNLYHSQAQRKEIEVWP